MTSADDWATVLTERRDDAKAVVDALLARSDANGGGRTDPNFLNALVKYRDAQALLDALIPQGTSVPITRTVNGHALDADVTVSKGDVGLGNVDNTSDANKPVSTAQQAALDLKAPLASPALTGTPTAPTAAPGTNTTQVATTAFTRAEVAALVNSAPGTLDTLGEIATQLASDESTAAALATTVGGKVSASLVDAKGDLLVGTANDTVARKAVGTDGLFLKADSTKPDGLDWAAAGGAGRFIDVVPSDVGALGWAYDPLLSQIAPTGSAPNGTTQLIGRIQVPVTISVTNLLAHVTVAGATLTASTCYASLYTVSGTTATLVGYTADQSSNWTSTGLKVMALAGGPFTITGGPGVFVYVGVQAAGTTRPTFAGLTKSNPASIPANLAQTAASGFRGTFRSGITAGVPSSSFDVSGLTDAAVTWAALS